MKRAGRAAAAAAAPAGQCSPFGPACAAMQHEASEHTTDYAIRTM